MFTFGKRNVIKQGGSWMISLPMPWIKSIDSEVKTVMIEMDSENRLRIIACDTLKDTTAINQINSGGCQ